jgi:LemA protein
MEILIPLAIIVGLPLLIVMIMYNGFIDRRNAMPHAFSSIDVQLKKRWDLIPNLVETVKKYASHEKETMEAVVQARNARSDSKE